MTVYYLGYPKHGWDEKETFEKMQKEDGFIELIHVHGTEKDKNYKYNHGNEAPHWGLYVSLLFFVWNKWLITMKRTYWFDCP